MAITPEILEPLDSMVYHQGDTIDFKVKWTMWYGGGQQAWVEDYQVNSGDYPPGIHTFKAEGWGRGGGGIGEPPPTVDSVTLCIFTFRLKEQLVKKYFTPLKPDSARIVYELSPRRYADPDSVPNPIRMEVEIRDCD